MNKKIYETPTIKKINLAVNNAVLNICETSVTISPATGFNCEQVPTATCFNPFSPNVNP